PPSAWHLLAPPRRPPAFATRPSSDLGTLEGPPDGGTLKDGTASEAARPDAPPEATPPDFLPPDDAGPGAQPDGRKSGGVASGGADRKSTRLNSSHGSISYAVFCLKNK